MINQSLHQLFKLMFIISSLFLSSCVQPVVFKSEQHAHIKSNYPIVAANGVKIEKSYEMDLKSGENSLDVLYNTYQYDYICRFNWNAKANTAYEITDQENQYPLTLYRWHNKNSLWAIRLDPVDPMECLAKPVQ